MEASLLKNPPNIKIKKVSKGQANRMKKVNSLQVKMHAGLELQPQN